jgi:MFS superfamily sulfate permease-like transporter
VTALTALNELASRIVWLIMLSLFFVFIVTAVAGPVVAAAAGPVVVAVVACAGVWIFDLAVNPRSPSYYEISQAVTELLRDPSVPGKCSGISDLGDELPRVTGSPIRMTCQTSQQVDNNLQPVC